MSTATDLVISRLVRAPRAAVWRAWTDPALLVQWWCPRPWTTELRGFELRPGGAVDGAADAAAGEELRVGGIDDGVDVRLLDEIADDGGDARWAGLCGHGRLLVGLSGLRHRCRPSRA